MIFGKTSTTLAAAAAIAAAAAVSVVAAAFALFAVLQPHLGAAGSAAVVAAVAAAIVGIAGLIAALKAEEKAQPAPGPDALAFAEKAIEMVKERPILTVGAGLAAGIIAFRNPALAAIVAKALLDLAEAASALAAFDKTSFPASGFLGLPAHLPGAFCPGATMFKLPDLPYAYEALEPTISANTLHFHHDKHHAAYVNALNGLLPEGDERPLEAVIKEAGPGKVFNNAAQDLEPRSSSGSA